MRCALGLVLSATIFISFPNVRAQAPKSEELKHKELLEQYQKKFKIAAETAQPSIASIVVSRSEHYPKIANPSDIPGKLGEFDLKEFLKNNPSPEKKKLGDYLDLSKVELIPNHGYLGGVLIDAAGLVLTPYHAIDGATKIYVFLPGTGGKPYGSYADIHAADARSDLAVLKLIHPPEKLKAITFADIRYENRGDREATMFEGKMVGLMFNPYSTAFTFDGKPSVYFGGITKIGHRIEPPEEKKLDPFNQNNRKLNNQNLPESFYKFGKLLEHDIERRDARKTFEPVNAGTTGGVLIDLEGHMVGMTSSTAGVYEGKVGPGYAIPTDDSTRKVIDVLRKGKEVEYGFMGITTKGDGLKIEVDGVTLSSPADLAGLRSGTIITRIDDSPVHSFEDLLLYAGCSLAGTRVKLTVIDHLAKSKEKTQDVYLTLGKYHSTHQFIASVRPEPVFGMRVDYLNFLQSDKRYSTGPVKGVSVREVIANSPADIKFKALGEIATKWIISHVNGTPVSNPTEFYAAVKDLTSIKLTLRDWEAPNRQELTLP
jgi:serine protease Do